MTTRQPKSRTSNDKGMLTRLQDQLKVYRKAQAIHSNKRMLDEIAFYPAHDPRRETPEYKETHRRLAIEQDRPCLICGVRNSTLKDKAHNLYGAKQMETHHHVLEWALANAIDAVKFNKILLPRLRARHPNKEQYKKGAFTADEVKVWVDHDEDNLWVLCDVHHRAKYFGIHEITYPIWGPVDLLRDDFEDYVRQETKKYVSKGGKDAIRKSPTGR
jgi:hypothetical protein